MSYGSNEIQIALQKKFIATFDYKAPSVARLIDDDTVHEGVVSMKAQ